MSTGGVRLQAIRYEARAFHDSLEGGRAGGELSITALGFQFRAGERSVDMPFQNAELRLGGAGDRLLFLSHPSRPGWSVYTADRSILRDPRLAAQPQLADALRQLQRRRRGGWLVGLAVAALLLAVPLALIFNVDVFAGMAARRVPPAWEQKLGRSVYAQYQLGADLLEDATTRQQLDTLTRALTDAAPSPRHPYQFHIARNAAINAFALPGGIIVIHSELILRARSAEELLGVLAHEMSHVSEQHGLRILITSAGVLVIAQTLLGDVTGLLATLGSAAPLLLNQSYSRSFESEADREGVALLRRAKIDPLGTVRFFEMLKLEEQKAREKLRKTTGERTAGVLEGVSGFLSTHPATERRIADIRRRVATDHGPYRNVDAEFLALQARVRTFVAQPPSTTEQTPDGNPH